MFLNEFLWKPTKIILFSVLIVSYESLAKKYQARTLDLNLWWHITEDRNGEAQS